MMARNARNASSAGSVPLTRLLSGLVLITGCSWSPKLAPSSGEGGAEMPNFAFQTRVAGGSESFQCLLAAFPETGYVTSASHDYTPGSHHFLVYTTDLTSIPPGEDRFRDCGADGGAVMNHVRGIFYAAQTPHSVLTYPPGVGLPVTKNQVLLFQVHYLNPGAMDLTANVDVHFSVDPDASHITKKAGFLLWTDPFVDVPPASPATAQMRCPIPKDITIMGMAPHYHARGVSLRAYLDRAPNDLATRPFFSWTRGEGALAEPVAVRRGSRIRFQCEYDNTSGSQEFFEGPSADSNEMCLLAASYYPAFDDSDVAFCSFGKGADMYGAGKVGCMDSLSCLGACAAQGGDAGAPGAPCEQKCFVESCPSASTALVPLINCLDQNCGSACGGTLSDGGIALEAGAKDGSVVAPDPCTACIESTCSNEVSACASSACP